MGVQSTIYDLETTDIRFFLSTKPIASKSHVAIWIKGDDNVYRIINESEYELINDNIVFSTHPSGKALELRVGDTPSDLVQAPNDIAIVSAIAGDVVIVADSVQDVITVSDNITDVTIVSDNMTELLVISTDIDQILLAKEYAINPIDTPITGNPNDRSSLHYANESKLRSEEAQTIVDSVNFPAGLIMEWDSDRKPAGWLWCDGESYTVFSPTPALAYDELYQVRVDTTYVMTTKPDDWDANYPDDPNGWYDPSFVGSVVTQDELDLLVTVPDRRGLFVRGKDQAGSVIPARGIDTHGIVNFDAVVPSQNKAHSHNSSFTYSLDGYEKGGSNDRWAQYGTGYTKSVLTESDGGAEGHGTYTSTNYIIRAKGSYGGDGTGSGGTDVAPIASEIDYSDTYGSGLTQLQNTTDDYFYFKSVIRKENALKDVTPSLIPETTTVLAGSYNTAVGYDKVTKTLRYIRGDKDSHNYIDVYDSTGTIVFTYFGNNKNVEHGGGIMSEAGLFTAGDNYGSVYDLSTYALIRALPRGYSILNHTVNWHSNTNGNASVRGDLDSTSHYFYKDLIASTAEQILTFGVAGSTLHATILTNTRMYVVTGDAMTYAPIDGNGDLGSNVSISYNGASVGSSSTHIYTVGYRAGYIYFRNDSTIFRISESIIDAGGTITPEIYTDLPSPYTRANIFDTDGTTEMDELSKYVYLTADGERAGFMHPELTEKQSLYIFHNIGEDSKIQNGDFSVDLSIVDVLSSGSFGLNDSDYSFIAGVDVLALHDYAYLVGQGLVSGIENQSVYGSYNVASTAKLVFGVGTSDVAKLNAVEMYDTGDVQAPNRLAVPEAKSLITKDIGDGLYHPKETGFTGSFLIANGDTVTVVNGIITTVAP